MTEDTIEEDFIDMDIYAKPGSLVRFRSLNPESVSYAGTNDPKWFLKLNEVYTVRYTVVYDWHTEVILEEYPELRFNSVHFEDYNVSAPQNIPA